MDENDRTGGRNTFKTLTIKKSYVQYHKFITLTYDRISDVVSCQNTGSSCLVREAWYMFCSLQPARLFSGRSFFMDFDVPRSNLPCAHCVVAFSRARNQMEARAGTIKAQAINP